jgi:exopolyphosphatase/guanosine-5'-triphosphate,3'-diphosphate pyrophosphatase
VATAAIRRAANGDELVRAIGDASGMTVTVLSGEEEARLAFIGAARTLDHVPDGPLGVVDVGGGSIELVVGDVPDTVGWWTSLAVGSADLAEDFFHSDPPEHDELSAARSRLASMLAGIQIPCAVEAVAVGGSATSLSRLAGQLLDATAFERALRLVTSRRATEIADWLSLDLERVRLMPAGLLILEAASKLFGVGLTVGRGGIREGVLLGGLSL